MNTLLNVQDLYNEENKVGLSSTNSKNDNQMSVYLAETFYITTKKNNVFQVKLTEKGLCLSKQSNGSAKEQLIQLQDIIGCRCLRSKRKMPKGSPCACSSLPRPAHLKVVEESSVDLDESDVSAYLYIYAYIFKKNRRGGCRRERTTLTLRFRSFDRYEDNNGEAQKWRNAVKLLVKGQSPFGSLQLSETRKMLIILNPKSGSGKARELFQQRAAPVFVEAEISYDLHVTKKANFAREFVRLKDVYSWRGIVVVGGDGIFFEVVNGLLERADWKRALDNIPLGIIPCGSGNGLARSIAHVNNEPYEPKPILGATLAIVKSKTTEMDLIRVETRSQTMFSFLSVGWGLISDIDIESERLRSIGYQRFALWTVHRLISLRTYHGKVSYLKAQQGSTITKLRENPYKSTSLHHSISCNAVMDCPECHGEGDCESCDTDFGDVLSLETSNAIQGSRPRLDSWYSATSRKSAYFSTAESTYQSTTEKDSTDGQSQTEQKKMFQMFGPASNIPAITTPVPETWVVEEGEFVMVHAAYQTHLGVDCFFAPLAKLSDGTIWLVIIRAGVTRSQLLSFLLGLSSGTHMPVEPNSHIEMIPVVAFRIEPSNNQGNITVDGELVEYGPVQGEVFSKLARIMVP